MMAETAGGSLFAEERKVKIIEAVRQHGKATVVDLSGELGG